MCRSLVWFASGNHRLDGKGSFLAGGVGCIGVSSTGVDPLELAVVPAEFDLLESERCLAVGRVTVGVVVVSGTS